VTAPKPTEHLRIGELAERAGVSVATIKFYIREGLLPPPSVKTGRTMGYYDLAYLDRLRLIRKLREEHYLPLRVIRTILDERGDEPLAPGDAELLGRVAPGFLRRVASAAAPGSRAELAARFGAREDDLAALEEMGLIGEGGGYSGADLELLAALRDLEAAGVDRARFPFEGMGHYVELLGELARREVRTFTHRAQGLLPEELESLAVRALALTEPVIALIRKKLILRALRAELRKLEPVPQPRTEPDAARSPQALEEGSS
jgi:DNA-binding transcriptional MerR regulator